MTPVVLTALAAAHLAVLLVVVGARRPDYRHVRHTISELGELGSPSQRVVALGVFLPVGLVLLLVAYLARSAAPLSAGLALVIAVGYLVAAAFPCDPGSPLAGSARQGLHNLGGGVEYVGGAFFLWRLGESLGQPFQALGFIVGATAPVLSFGTFAWRGLVQRLAELALFGGLCLSLFRVSSQA